MKDLDKLKRLYAAWKNPELEAQCRDALKRIERLEAALREIVNTDPVDPARLPLSAGLSMRNIARAALEPAK